MSNNVQDTMKQQLNMSFQNVPYLGKPFLRKESDPETHQPQPALVTHARVFDLANPQDMAAYEAIMQNVAINKSYLYEMDRQYVQADKNFVVYLHWADMYMVNPDIAGDIAVVRAEAGAKRLPNQCEDIAPKTVGQPTDNKE